MIAVLETKRLDMIIQTKEDLTSEHSTITRNPRPYSLTSILPMKSKTAIQVESLMHIKLHNVQLQ